jgi:hypothetical protein
MSLYKDASLVMIPSAYKDGKLYSIRPVPEYGAEEVTNGDFATDSNWTKGTGVTISNGSATSSTGGVYIVLNQPTSIVVGTIYQYSFNVTIVSGGIRLGDTSSVWSNTATSSGIYSGSVTAANGVIYFTSPSNDFVGSINSVSVKEVLVADGDFTFSRGSNLAATRVDVNGLIEKGRENILLRSNEFDNAYWTKSASTISTGQADPNGGSNAFKIVEDTSTNYHRIFGGYTMVSGNVYATSVTAKAAGRNFLTLSNNVSSGTCIFNLTDGSIATQESNVISAKTTSLGGGWYRCEMVAAGDKSGSYNVFIGTDDDGTIGTYTGDGTSGVLIYQSQLELGLVATDYIETGASTAQAGILEDMPRLDYSGGASCPSLLLEPQRTNLVTNSEYIGGYINFGSADTANETTSPEGIVNATLIEGDGTQTQIYTATPDIIVPSAGSYTLSIFAKKGTEQYLRLGLDGFIGSSNNGAYFDLSAATATAQGTGNTASIEDYGNGWYRCYVTATIDAGDLTGKLAFNVTPSTSSVFYGSAGAANGKNIYIYGAQLEAGSYPTSYIPTYGTSQTRNNDYAKVDNRNNIGQTEGALFVEMSKVGFGLSPAIENVAISMFEISSSFQRYLVFRNNGVIQYVEVINGVQAQIISTSGVYTDGENIKIAAAYAQDDFVLYVNGTLINTDSSGNIAPCDRLVLGYSNDSTFIGQNKYKQVLLFKTRLTNAELAALTTL